MMKKSKVKHLYQTSSHNNEFEWVFHILQLLQNNPSAFHLLYRTNEKSFVIFCCLSFCKNKVYNAAALVIELFPNNKQKEVYEDLRSFYPMNVTNANMSSIFFF